VQYCEVNPFCQQVLVERMEEGRLDRASIHADIKTLHVSTAIAPSMICGGFPCQDISSIGLQKGIVDGERSSLFYEIMRIADECPSVRVIFLENVGNIVKCGMREVVEECSRRGFDMQWTMRSAASQGAPHMRQRWFCLATRGHVGDTDLVTDLSSIDAKRWDVEHVPRISFKPDIRTDASYDENWIARCQCLGNAVVPSVVRDAFVELMTARRNWSNMAACLTDYGVSATDMNYPYPETGLVVQGTFFAIPKKKLDERRHAVDLTVRMGVDRVLTLGNFPTPRRGITHPSSLSERSIRDLPTLLVNCEESRAYIASTGVDASVRVLPNVNYIEWMMGYDADWTRVRRYKGRSKRTDGDDGGNDGGNDEGNDGTDNKPPPRRRGAASGGSSGFKLNGMHMLMKENPGRGVTAVAEIWRSLSSAERAVYTARAIAEGNTARGHHHATEPII
jgi:hypothetical protein